MEKGRYLLFCFDDCYPSGGMSDCVASFDSRDHAIAEYKKRECEYDNCYIYDLEEFESFIKA